MLSTSEYITRPSNHCLKLYLQVGCSAKGWISTLLQNSHFPSHFMAVYVLALFLILIALL